MMFLRQSTASQEVLLGPFLDDTDGKTAETALSIANTDIKVWKWGGTSESNKNSGGATHIAGGRYYATLDATDTDTVGGLTLNVHVSGALPVRLECWVLEEAVFDALFAASAAGYQVPIWSSAGATVNLSATTIKTATDVETDTADIQSRLPTALTGAGNMKADALAFSGDATAADNAEAFFDGTGYEAANNAIADALLKRDVDQVEATAAVDSLCYVILAARYAARSGSTLTVYKTDGVTAFNTRTLTTTGSPVYIVSMS